MGAPNGTAPKYIIMILGRNFMCFQKCIPVRYYVLKVYPNLVLNYNYLKLTSILSMVALNQSINTRAVPAGTRRNNNVFTTSTRRRRRRVDVVKTFSLRHYCVMCPLGCLRSIISLQSQTFGAPSQCNDRLSQIWRFPC